MANPSRSRVTITLGRGAQKYGRESNARFKDLGRRSETLERCVKPVSALNHIGISHGDVDLSVYFEDELDAGDAIHGLEDNTKGKRVPKEGKRDQETGHKQGA
ncbi:Hypothetical predicted protein [Olea europaea subsp. europaea]|uniref:Uncharacterized protein n=1 Tax=Olea europaea subsp. europaea TaxID=158383 RepID=A0A8S0RM70_OLEEU|nr:Hypothetical predicted protein [Olea europaea subsp. europaea]